MCFLLSFVVIYLATHAFACDFPDFLQSNSKDGTERSWQGHVTRPRRDNSRTYHTLIGFSGQIMTSKVVGGTQLEKRPRDFKRECLNELKPGRYLVEHSEGSRDGRYTCMQFFWRSENIVEIKEAAFSDRITNALCEDDHLKLIEWPLLNRIGLNQHRVKCPLEGGFNIDIFHRNQPEETCQAYRGETRIESECERDDGMYFRFRTKRCVPPGLGMKETQRVFCAGSWTDAGFKFVVLRHDRLDRQWCLRLPVEKSDTFTMLLFKDVYCSRHAGDTMLIKQDFLRINAWNDIPVTPESLCMDDYEICHSDGNLCAKDSTKMVCAKRCHVCNEGKPTLCDFPPSIRGLWVDSTARGDEVVEITQHFLKVRHHMALRCVNWTENDPPTFTEFSNLVVATFDNGCRPRYACAKFKVRRNHPVLRYKLSHNKVWPIEEADPSKVDCSAFEKSFRDDKPPIGDKVHSRHYKVLVTENKLRKEVPCRLGPDREFNVTFNDGETCQGSLKEGGYPVKSHMYMTLGCSLGKKNPVTEYACLDSTKREFLSNVLIVTQRVRERNALECWMFPALSSHTFYLLSASDCHIDMLEKIREGKVKPIATFQISPIKLHPRTKTGSTTNPNEENLTFKKGSTDPDTIGTPRTDGVPAVGDNSNGRPDPDNTAVTTGPTGGSSRSSQTVTTNVLCLTTSLAAAVLLGQVRIFNAVLYATASRQM